MNDRNRTPLVRPPRFAQGGGVASAFGGSGAPSVPVPGTRRGRELAIQYADDERGRFTERIFEFPQYPPLLAGGAVVAGATSAQTIQVTSNRTSFVRLVAIRGILQLSDSQLSGFETANLMLRLQINGEEDLTTSGQKSNPSSFAMLFANPTAPWLWMACPPRLRTGDVVQATVTNITPVGEGAPILTPEIACRLVDDDWWRALYGGDYDDEPDDNYGPQG
jgi:hypothetical protein